MGERVGYYNDENVTLSVELNFKLDDWEQYFNADTDDKLRRLIADEILGEIQARFTQGGKEKHWKPKKALTVAFEGGSTKPLIYTGQLQKSFQWVYSAGNLVVFTRKTYAKVQNFGAGFRTTPKQTRWMWANLFKGRGGIPEQGFWINIPARKFMYFTPALTKRVKTLIFTSIKKSEKIGV